MEQSQKNTNADDFIISYDDLKKATQKFDQQDLISSPSEQNGAASDDRNHYFFSLLPIVALLFLTINVSAAFSRAIATHNRWMVVFIVSTYINMLLLFWCLRLFEKVPDDSKWRPRLRVTAWCLTTSLTVMFCYKVALEMPMVFKVAVWATGGCTVAVGFYVLFLCRQERCDSNLMKGAKQIQDELV